MNLRPVNGYVLIEPVVHDSFIVGQKDSYDEIGIVLAADGITDLKIGTKVYFDSFMAKKYPNPDKPGEFFWLVHHDEIGAISE